jgi:ABC transporter substrate binding protein
MRRREFITLLSSVAVGWPLAARAERPPFLVGMIGNAPSWSHFREAMRDLGYSEGQNVKYELRTDEIEPARLAEAAKELASIPVDVIATYGSPPSQAAQAATRTIPIVMVAVGDPVRAGLVASLAHPGGNITGTGGKADIPNLQGKCCFIASQNRSAPVDFDSINIPRPTYHAVGDCWISRVVGVHLLRLVLSWCDTRGFSVGSLANCDSSSRCDL